MRKLLPSGPPPPARPASLRRLGGALGAPLPPDPPSLPRANWLTAPSPLRVSVGDGKAKLRAGCKTARRPCRWEDQKRCLRGKKKIKKQPRKYGGRGDLSQSSPCMGTLGTLLLKTLEVRGSWPPRRFNLPQEANTQKRMS